jgi:hypothetical protein
MTLAPEYVSVNDMVGAIELLVRSTEFVTADNSAADRKRIHDRVEPHLGRLRSTYEEWGSWGSTM